MRRNYINVSPAVYLTGADNYRWALDEDFKETQKALEGFLALTHSPHSADIIHSVYWESLKDLPESILKNKFIICNLSGEWDRYERDFRTPFLHIAQFVNTWVVRSHQAQKDLEKRGKTCFFIPYTVDTKTFVPFDKSDFKPVLSLPKNTYVIGNFMRDTQAGRGRKPKLVKGPDIFADIVTSLREAGKPVHVLLAGPRRHWLRKTLKERGVPFSYAGWPVPFEDMRINTLNRKKLNRLYNQLDLSIVSSRSEAGPHAILEAGAANCPQISTRVGIAEDILPEENLYNTVAEAVGIIERDMGSRNLSKTSNRIYKTVTANHTADAVAPLYKTLYKSVIK